MNKGQDTPADKKPGAPTGAATGGNKDDGPPPLEIVISGGIHPASSATWGDEAYAKLCSYIVESNNGRAQQIIENNNITPAFMELYSKEELLETDDLGLSLPFIAVYHDRPEMLRYLYNRGLDITIPCDSMNFGNPMFYAVIWHKYRLVDMLDLLGCSVSNPCDSFKQSPRSHAERLDDSLMIELINNLEKRPERVKTLFMKNFLKAKYRRLYKNALRAIILIQRIIRGKLARMKAISKRKKLRAKLKKEKKMLEEGGGVAEPSSRKTIAGSKTSSKAQSDKGRLSTIDAGRKK
jgi:hypothetical protein